MTTRDERQKTIISKWIANNGWGIILAFTGFGKTRTILKSINHIDIKDITVIVPTLYLKEQWEAHLKDVNVQYQVLVINTASTMKFYTDYLVIDELHTACADEWQKVLTNIESKYFFGTTATTREDDKWLRALDKAPVIDIVTIEEGLVNNWIAEHNIYTIPVNLTADEFKNYKKADNKFKYHGSKLKMFGNPLSVARNWLMWINIKRNKNDYKTHIKTGKIYSIRFITEEYAKVNKEIEWFKFRDLNNIEVDRLFENAMTAKNYYAAIRERKQIISNASNKILVANELLRRHNSDKTIVFGESVDFLYKLNHNDCFYHSKMTKKENKTNIDKFINNKVNTIFSCKALNTGVDIPGVKVGIITSYNSSKLTSTQIRGRSTRKEGDKISYIYYIYVKNTQDEVWLSNALDNVKYTEFEL